MYWTMVRREVFGRRRQTIVVAAGLAIAIALVIVVSSLSTGVTQAQAEALEGIYGVGTDITVTGATAEPGDQPSQQFEFGENDGTSTGDGTQKLSQSRLMTDSMRGTIDASTVNTISQLSDVAAATGALSLTNTTFSGELPDSSQRSDNNSTSQPGDAPSGGMQGGPGGQGGSSFGIDSFSVLGVDPSVTAVGPLSGVEVTAGRALKSSDSGKLVALVDSTYADTEELSTGDTITVGEKDVTIVGIVSSTTNQSDAAADVFLPLKTAQTLSDSGDVVSTIYVSAESASSISSVQDQIETALPDATVSTQPDLAEQISGSLSSAASLITNLGRWLSLIVLVVAFVLAILLTSSGVTRRRREIGTLKAIGWSNKRVVGQIAGESLARALIGGLAGLALGLGAIAIINIVSPTLHTGGASASATGMANMQGGGPGGGSGGGMGGMGGMGGNAMSTLASSSDITLHAPLTIWIILAAVGLAILGGIIAGSFAAWRASKLSPAEALRTVA